MEAKDYLAQIKRLDLQVKNKLIEKKQWEDIATGITAASGSARVQASGAKSKIENAVAKLVDAEAEIDDSVDRLIAVKRSIVRIIEQVDNPTEYNVLHMRYIQFKSLQEIADHYKRDYGWATTVHGRALKNVQELIDGASL